MCVCVFARFYAEKAGEMRVHLMGRNCLFPCPHKSDGGTYTWSGAHTVMFERGRGGIFSPLKKYQGIFYVLIIQGFYKL